MCAFGSSFHILKRENDLWNWLEVRCEAEWWAFQHDRIYPAYSSAQEMLQTSFHVSRGASSVYVSSQIL